LVVVRAAPEILRFAQDDNFVASGVIVEWRSLLGGKQKRRLEAGATGAAIRDVVVMFTAERKE